MHAQCTCTVLNARSVYAVLTAVLNALSVYMHTAQSVYAPLSVYAPTAQHCSPGCYERLSDRAAPAASSEGSPKGASHQCTSAER